MSVISIENLVKYYEGRCVLDNISLRIPQGCIYGLLGRNGVGKTTLIRILLGLENPSRGNTYIFGKSSGLLSRADKGRIGYVAEGHHLLGHYRVSELVDLAKNLSKKWNQKFFESTLEMFSLPMDRKIKQLSNGMRAQLNLAIAMSTEPQLLIMDDPTLGLDTVVRRQFLEFAIDVIQKDGRTILFSSHILSDVERIADRIGLMINGRIVVDCSLERLKQLIRQMRIIFTEAAPQRVDITDIIRCRRGGRELLITIANWDENKRRVIESYRPESIVEVPMTLEDIFVECTDSRDLSMPAC